MDTYPNTYASTMLQSVPPGESGSRDSHLCLLRASENRASRHKGKLDPGATSRIRAASCWQDLRSQSDKRPLPTRAVKWVGGFRFRYPMDVECTLRNGRAKRSRC